MLNKEHYLIPPGDYQNIQILFRDGLCAANLHFFDNIEAQQRFRSSNNFSRIINALMNSGCIDDKTKTPFDDRKIRYDSHLFDGRKLIVNTGITFYQAFEADLKRDLKLNELIKELGKRDFNDPWAYFARPIGISGLVLTKDNKIVLGRRNSEVFKGEYHPVEGHLTFQLPSQISLERELLKELNEELCFQEESLTDKPKFIGASLHNTFGFVLFSYLVRTNLKEEYFLDNHFEEHEDMQVLTREDLNKFLLSHPITVSTNLDIDYYMNFL